MNTSESIKEIAPALLKAQKAIKAALKDSTNPHFRSKYADLSSVIDAVKAPLNDSGILFTQGVSGADSAVTVETRLIHTSGEWVASALTVPLVKHDAQGVGSAITYGRRYGLQALCGVPAEDDDGNAAAGTTRVSAKIEADKGKVIPTAGAVEQLTPARREYCDRVVSTIIDCVNAGQPEDAWDSYKEVTDTDEKVAVWSLLPKEIKKVIKTEGEKQGAK